MLRSDEEYEQVVFADDDFGTSAATGGRLIDCTVTHCSFGQKKMRKCRLTDCQVADTRLVGTDIAETTWHGCALSGCVLAGVQWFSSELRRVTFSGCKLDSVNFRECVLRDVGFENCLLRDVDFGSARLTDVKFGGGTLGADFTKAMLERVDLRGAELGITAGYDALRGATISTVQLVGLAPLLAGHLGITVED